MRRSGATSGDTAATDPKSHSGLTRPLCGCLRTHCPKAAPGRPSGNGATSPWTVSVFEAGLTGVGVVGVGDVEGVTEEASRGADSLWEEERDPDSAAVRAGESPLRFGRVPKLLEDLHQRSKIIHQKVKIVEKKLLKIYF